MSPRRTPLLTPSLSTHSSVHIQFKLGHVHGLWWTCKAHPSFNFGTAVFSWPERTHRNLCATVTVNKLQLGLNLSNWVWAFARIDLCLMSGSLLPPVRVTIAVKSQLRLGIRRGSVVDQGSWRNKNMGVYEQLSVKRENSVWVLCWFSNSQDLWVKSPARVHARACFAR